MSTKQQRGSGASAATIATRATRALAWGRTRKAVSAPATLITDADNAYSRAVVILANIHARRTVGL